MSGGKISRNSPCPCGSGKKYKRCCWGKDFDWVEGAEGNSSRSAPISEELAADLADHLEMQSAQLGRDPGPDDLVFPGLLAEHAEHELSQAMLTAGIDPAIIYAFEKTGFLVTEDNQESLSDLDLEEWREAVEEYNAMNGRDEELELPVGTLAYYGPDDAFTSKIVASVNFGGEAEPIIRRWVGSAIREDQRVKEEIDEFFQEHGVSSVGGFPFNIGCPHEEGEDFKVGEDCPFCPYWEGKQGEDRWDLLCEKLERWREENEETE